MTLQKINKKLSKVVSLITVISFVLCPQFGFALDVHEVPNVRDVINGVKDGNFQTTINPDGTVRMDITAPNRMIANYNSFNIGQLAGVYFHQPDASSVALNRVVGVDPSTIMGVLNSNGRIFLVNPNGVVFGASSRVDTAGLVASTLDIRDDDFMAGRFTFYGQGGSVVNQGYISAPGGFVALLGSTVENAGVIEANLGTVVLASGEALTLNMDPAGTIGVVIDEATSKNLEQKDDAVKNSGSIMANGGKVILTAKTLDGVFKKAVNNTGVIEAKSLVNQKGEVYLLGSGENAFAANTGTIDVSATEAGADGGFVEISAPKVIVDGNINVTAADGEAGELKIDPWDLYILSYNPTILGNNVNGDDVEWWEGGLLGYITESWLESFSGNLTIQAVNDINFKVGEKYGIFTGWKPISGADDQLNLSGFTAGNTFKAEAGRNINLDDDSVVTAGGNISFNSGLLSSGDINLGTGAGLNSSNGNIALNGTNVNLTALVNAGSGNVSIAAQDDIIDNSDSGATDIIANVLDMIGDKIGTNSNRIETDVNVLNSATANNGGVYLTNDGNLDVVAASANSAGKDVKIQTTNGGNLTARSISASRKVVLDSDGAILDDNNDLTYISANDIDLTAKGNIGSTLGNYDMDAGYLDVALGSGKLSIDTTGGGLTGGDFYINQVADGDLYMSNVKVATSSTDTYHTNAFIVNQGGDIIADDGVLDAKENIMLAASNIIVDAAITTSGNLMFLAFDNVALGANIKSGQDIDIAADFSSTYLKNLGLGLNGGDGTGAITQSAGVVGQGTENLILSAAQGIGLNTSVKTLRAENTKPGDININNSGALGIIGSGVVNSGGNVDISTSSPLVVDGDVTASGNISLAAGETPDDVSTADSLTVNADIISELGNILLSAGDDITQNTGSTIQTQNVGNTVTLLGGYPDSSKNSRGNIEQNGNAQILTNNGDVDLTAWGDVKVGYINAGTGKVNLN
ncbi:MAG: filamentous hemagglutinin N-terminal domain-containing protein [Candidatus Omnitrophica bacterium]|nr:filamentous hemagglutinin N-terminal domain-containing protein [Candidatus Omnitrophota bacterium]